VISVVLYQILPVRQRFIAYLSNFASSTFFLISAGVTIWFTITQIQFAITTALETGEEVKIGVQITLIAAGLLLFYLAWKVWNSAVHHESNRGFVLKLLAALFLLVGGWILLAELPMAIQAGDEDLWQGLVVTVYYAMGTIPFQLSFAIMLAYLLFQKVRAREFFRVVYFLPYVTPAVAGAAVFQLLFSNRSSSPANLLLRVTGGEAARWLQESRGVFVLIGQSMGVEVPGWMGGPSLALVVIIIYSIWTYVGYDTVIYLAGMGNIPLELNEAAEIDGANRWQIFRYVTFPLLSPTTYFLSLIAVIGTFKAFNHIFVMRDPLALGTVDTFSVAIFDEFFNRTRFGYASAMAFVLFAVILALTYVNNKVQGSRVFYE
jgi:multiple sugar transport system permease protein